MPDNLPPPAGPDAPTLPSPETLLDRLLGGGNSDAAQRQRDVQAGRYFLTISDRRIRQCLAALSDNDDAETTKTADAALGL